VSLFRFVPVTALGEVRMPPDWTFVIASSGVQADKAGSVMHLYNRASNGARALLAIWNRRAPQPAASLADALATAPEAIEQLTSWLEPSADGAFSITDLDKRLRHFVRETARGPKAAAAFRDADRAALGELSAESQREADTLLGNQIPETIAMAKLARDLGAFGASSFGAGFGGSVWAAVPLTDATAFGEEWTRAYERKMPVVGRVPWFVARPGPAATEVSLG
jgi:galactokinase